MWRLCGALLVVACSSNVSEPCRLRLVADLQAAITADGIQVITKVNRVDTPLIVDTGAELTVITSATVKSLLLAGSRLTASQLVGIGGTVTNADVYAALQLGTDDVQQRFAVADVPNVKGLIGGDLLSDYDVEFDLPDGRVRLWKASRCGINDLPWSGPRTMLPAQVTWRNQLVLTVLLDGKPVSALVDSGSSLNLLQTGAARRVGVTTLLADPIEYVRGIDGSVIGVRLHTFLTMDIGANRVTAPRIGVGESQFQHPEMILGRDYLRSRRMWISYQTERVFVQ
jgi:predicted aspartyl protease